jgi:hypothetical protein
MTASIAVIDSIVGRAMISSGRPRRWLLSGLLPYSHGTHHLLEDSELSIVSRRRLGVTDSL